MITNFALHDFPGVYRNFWFCGSDANELFVLLLKYNDEDEIFSEIFHIPKFKAAVAMVETVTESISRRKVFLAGGSQILLVVAGKWLRVGKTAQSVELCRRQDLAGVREADGRQRPSVSGQRKATCKWNLRPIFLISLIS